MTFLTFSWGESESLSLRLSFEVPLLVTLATFLTYIHLDPVNNKITAEKVNNCVIQLPHCDKQVFACIAIFNLIRLPLFLFPTFLLRVVQVPTFFVDESNGLKHVEFSWEWAFAASQPSLMPRNSMSRRWMKKDKRLSVFSDKRLSDWYLRHRRVKELVTIVK